MCRAGGRRCPGSGGRREPAGRQGDAPAGGEDGPLPRNIAIGNAQVGVQGDTVHVQSITMDGSGVHVTMAPGSPEPSPVARHPAGDPRLRAIAERAEAAARRAGEAAQAAPGGDAGTNVASGNRVAGVQAGYIAVIRHDT